jgi:hypothetical protein
MKDSIRHRERSLSTLTESRGVPSSALVTAPG